MATTDPWLTQIYGTGGEDDLEKTAQMHILAKLAEEEGVDLSGLDDQELESLYHEVAGGEEVDDDSDGQYVDDGSDGQEYADPAVQEEYLAKEAQAKFEEADFLGRVMAHSFTQEMDKVAAEKQAKAKWRTHFGIGGEAGKGAKVRGGARDQAQSKARDVKKAMDDYHKADSTRGNMLINSRKQAPKATTAKMRYNQAKNTLKAGIGHAKHHLGRAASHVKANKAAYGIGAGATLAAGGAGYALNKEASAFEKLALEHAANILQANGIDPSTGAPVQEMQQPDPQEQFGQALDHRALQILQENGYNVDGLIDGGEEEMDDGQGGYEDPNQGGFQGGMQA